MPCTTSLQDFTLFMHTLTPLWHYITQNNCFCDFYQALNCLMPYFNFIPYCCPRICTFSELKLELLIVDTLTTLIQFYLLFDWNTNATTSPFRLWPSRTPIDSQFHSINLKSVESTSWRLVDVTAGQIPPPRCRLFLPLLLKTILIS
jgi:hypothetical protein